MEIDKGVNVVSCASGKNEEISQREIRYSEEKKEQTVRHVLESGKSAAKVSKELGIEPKSTESPLIKKHPIQFTELHRFLALVCAI